jgi:hypothetical protein
MVTGGTNQGKEPPNFILFWGGGVLGRMLVRGIEICQAVPSSSPHCIVSITTATTVLPVSSASYEP